MESETEEREPDETGTNEGKDKYTNQEKGKRQ